MKNGLFEYGDQVTISATDEKGIVNTQQLNEEDAVEVKLNSGEIKQYDADDLEFDLDFQPDTGE
ncbi:hypothetical protein [Mucilaginibacter sp. KACC 22063]|uniref:hypothetical protein n=1 Tax=Mucilaginibacter sp. KACC 22063 TaxID=3025666 RepID=UPI0023663699|nr:hypothetical protein [Mucilaginibacter sp. KACC 22063]WDF56893.1 hypothetical protein PQ461_07470 [Mucilaginibacter sp. KACC 22063]